MAVPKNPDLTYANKIPGVYVYNLLNSAGGADEDEARTVLLFGERISTAANSPADRVVMLNSEEDAIFHHGRASSVHRMYRSAVAQIGEGNARFASVGVAPAGVAATHKFTIYTTGATNPTAAGTLRAQVCGEEVSVAYSTSDTATTIATELESELDKLTNLPVTFGRSGAAITATYNVAGALGEDVPIRFYYDEQQSTGILVGTTLTAAVNAVGNGSISLMSGTQTTTASITGGQNPAQMMTALQTALAAADNFATAPATVANAANPAAGVLTIAYRSGYDVRRLAAYVTTSTGTTLTLDGGAATDGAGAGVNSKTLSGTLGTGLPTLTTALANISAYEQSFGEWVHPWNAIGTSTTGMQAILNQIEADCNGEIQRNNHATVCSVASETDAATLAAAGTPALNGTDKLRYIIGWCPDAPQQAYELAARRAAMMAAWSTTATNSDGAPLRTSSSVPLNSPTVQLRASRGNIKAALLDGLEPWAIDDGNFVVLRGRNTTSSSEEELWDPSFIRQIGEMRRQARAGAAASFSGAILKADGQINQPNHVTTDAIVAFLVGLLFSWEQQGIYDGAEQLKSAVSAEIDGNDRSRVNAVFPASPVIPLHQLGIVSSRTAPTL